MTKQKRLPITSKATGEVRLSEPVPGRKSWRQDSAKPDGASNAEPTSASTLTELTGEPSSAREQGTDENASGAAKAKRGEKTGTKQD